jgi:hypothetical protein
VPFATAALNGLQIAERLTRSATAESFVAASSALGVATVSAAAKASCSMSSVLAEPSTTVASSPSAAPLPPVFVTAASAELSAAVIFARSSCCVAWLPLCAAASVAASFDSPADAATCRATATGVCPPYDFATSASSIELPLATVGGVTVTATVAGKLAAPYLSTATTLSVVEYEALGSPRASTTLLIAAARSSGDSVCVESPPLAALSEAVVVAANVQRRGRSSSSSIQREVQILKSVSPAVPDVGKTSRTPLVGGAFTSIDAEATPTVLVAVVGDVYVARSSKT